MRRRSTWVIAITVLLLVAGSFLAFLWRSQANEDFLARQSHMLPSQQQSQSSKYGIAGDSDVGVASQPVDRQAAHGDVSAEVSVISSEGSAVEGAVLYRSDSSVSFDTMPSSLATTDERGKCSLLASESLDVAVVAPGFVTALLTVSGGNSYRVTLAKGHTLKVVCRDGASEPVSGVALIASKGALLDPRLHPGFDSDTAVYSATTDDEGVATLTGLSAGTYTVLPRLVKRIVTASNVFPQMLADVPGVDVVMNIEEARAGILRVAGEEIVAHKVSEEVGVGFPIGIFAGVCTKQKLLLEEKHKGAIALVYPPLWRADSTSVVVEVCLKRRGWLPAKKLVLKPLSAVVPEDLDAGLAISSASTASVTVVLRDYDGRVLSDDTARILARDSTGAIISNFAPGAAVEMPEGRVSFQCVDSAYSAFLKPQSMDLRGGGIVDVNMSLSKKVYQASISLVFQDKPVEAGQYFVSVRKDGRLIISNFIMKPGANIALPAGPCGLYFVVPGYKAKPKTIDVKAVDEVQPVEVVLERRA